MTVSTEIIREKPVAHKLDVFTNVEIRVRGTVQGVGFRPNVWRLARQCDLVGDVKNDASGVLITVHGQRQNVDTFCKLLDTDIPILSKIDSIEINTIKGSVIFKDFQISESNPGETNTNVTSDAAICLACKEETLSPFERRYRYPFTNCTHCGPRFSIVEKVPYDRANTTMATFEMCDECRAEYENPQDRRFHAQPVACYKCGPKAWLEHLGEGIVTFDMHSMLDDVDAVCSLLQKGEIVAIRGIGGFHLACDATNEKTLKLLRERKKRDAKPFALMARDIDIIKSHCIVSKIEEELLNSAEAPIVLLEKSDDCCLPNEIAPGLNTVGFMLPYTPMHHLILRRMERPVVMTSANISNAPQVTQNEAVKEKLSGIADYALFHDRDISNRVDDSVVRVVGGTARIMRRSRGYAPGAISLPDGFAQAPDVLAYGGELKSTFCLFKNGTAILSQHQGDLEDPDTYDDYCSNLKLYEQIYDHKPALLACDKHPEYLSTKLAREQSQANNMPLVQIQHHHAHIASCMVENGLALDCDPVLGIALDGVGFGDDGTIWGGEFMITDYHEYNRVGTFKPIAMIGGAQAIKEPWRNAYAHIVAEMGWDRFAINFSELELFKILSDKPREMIDQMLKNDINVPLASSCGRLFDAVAAAVGLCTHIAAYEGQGAMLLEAAIDQDTLNSTGEDAAYPLSAPNLQTTSMPYIEPLAMWQALLGDLILKTPVPVMAARFHKGLAEAIVLMAEKCAKKVGENDAAIKQIVLTGGCFQNGTLLELVTEQLIAKEYQVLTHSRVPANDGGLALGQVAIAAATAMKNRS
ncbi:MAG: carbamoyltransferase HypF [Rhizobiales bacterium]|nr:carbamoyltransferase HypF [Hyphomicrobiales bacterium]